MEDPNKKPHHFVWKPIYTRILILAQKGWTSEKIGKEVGLSGGAVNAIRRKDEFKHRLEGLDSHVVSAAATRIANSVYIREAREILEQSVKKAAYTVRRMAVQKHKEEDNRLRLDACREIFNRAGLLPREISVTEEVTHKYSPEDVKNARDTLEELKNLSDIVTPGKGRFIISEQTQKITLKGAADGVQG